MIGKLLTHRATRELAIRTMLRALDEFLIVGRKTTIPLLREVLRHPDFRAGEHDTGFIGRYFGAHPSPGAVREA
jgi:biotin carboxylase